MLFVEFKYGRDPEVLMMQMSGELRGLKAINISDVVPELVDDDNLLRLHFRQLHHSFFRPGEHYDRETADEVLTNTFGVTDIYANFFKVDEEGNKITVCNKIIDKGVTLQREDDDEKLIYTIKVRNVEE